MKDIRNLGARNYYLWSKTSSTSIPWERQYLNRDFYKSEIKRLLNTADWHSKFKKAEPKSILPNVQYYIIPHKHSRVFWVKKQILEKFPDYKILWLSAIHNSPQTPIFALVPGDLKLPNYYSMIEIENPVKIQFIHKKNNETESCIMFEDFKVFEPDKILVDVPCDTSRIQNLISENLFDDFQLATSFQSPIIGSPYISGMTGGIGFNSYNESSPFSNNLVKTIMRLAPPCYTGVYPTEKYLDGVFFNHLPGVKLKFAEDVLSNSQRLSSAINRNQLRLCLNERYRQMSDYSIFSSIPIDIGNSKDNVIEGFQNFFHTDITLANPLENFINKKGFDLDTRTLEGMINEDTWIQIAHTRQLNPVTNNDSNQEHYQQLVNQDLKVILSDHIRHQATLETYTSVLAEPASLNLERIASSCARSEQTDIVGEKHFKSARNLILQNFSDMCNSAHFATSCQKIFSSKISSGQSAIQNILIANGSLDLNSLWQKVKPLKTHADIHDLERHLKWNVDRQIIGMQGNKYFWTFLDKSYL